MNEDAYVLLLDVADDFLAQMDDGVPIDPADVYDWLVAQAREVAGGTTDTRDRTTGAHSGAQGRETHARTEVATTDGDAGQ